MNLLEKCYLEKWQGEFFSSKFGIQDLCYSFCFIQREQSKMLKFKQPKVIYKIRSHRTLINLRGPGFVHNEGKLISPSIIEIQIIDAYKEGEEDSKVSDRCFLSSE